MVLVVAADGIARKRSVKIGLRTPQAVQILEGVSAGDDVITQGGYGLDDGAKVKIGDAKDDDNGAEQGASGEPKPKANGTSKDSKRGAQD